MLLPVWSLLWLFKVFRLVNRLLQKSQANFRLPSCISLWSWIFIFYASGYPRAYPVVLNIYILYFRLPSYISLWSWIFIFYTSGYPRAYPCGPEYSYFILPVTLVHILVVLNIYILYFRFPSCSCITKFPQHYHICTDITTFAQTLPHLHKH